MELNELASDRIEAIRRANALKSQEKIKQLTAEHLKKKSLGKEQQQSADPDVVMSDGEEDSKQAQDKPAKKNGKGR